MIIAILATHVRSTSPAEAEDSIGSVYQRPTLRDTDEPFIFEQHTRGDGRANITRFRISSRAAMSVELDGVVGIGHLRSGEYRAESNGTAIDPTGPFVLRPGQGRSWSTAMDLTMVNLNLDAVATYAHTHDVLAAHDPFAPYEVRFDQVAASSPDAARHWNITLAHVIDVFRDDALLRHDLIRTSAIDLLFAAALTTFTFPATDDVNSYHPASIRRALQYIDDHVADPITVTDVAQAARLSPRALESGFRRALDTTPSQRLRDVRLAHIHADLLAANPTTDSVAAIARRWGITHLGRFATLYRNTYRQLPRETLAQ